MEKYILLAMIINSLLLLILLVKLLGLNKKVENKSTLTI